MQPGPILIVDDEAEVRDALSQALGQGGYEVFTAPSAAAGLALLDAHAFPVILTDYHMPGLSGLDFLSEIKARAPETFCVVITGFASTEVAVEALKRGAYDFIQKPFRIGQIEATISRALDHALTKAQLAAYQHRLEELVVARTTELHQMHDEVLELNALLISVQGERDVSRRLAPFLAHLRERYAPDEDAVLVQEGGQWRVAAQSGPRTWTLEEFQGRLAKLHGPMHLPAGMGALEEGYLIPLGPGAQPLGVAVLGFRQRSAFQPAEALFDLWCRQVEAALHGWACLHALIDG